MGVIPESNEQAWRDHYKRVLRWEKDTSKRLQTPVRDASRLTFLAGSADLEKVIRGA